MSSSTEIKGSGPLTLTEWEAQLPPPPQPIGSYVPAVITGHLLMTSGTLPVLDGKVMYTGPVDEITSTIEKGQAAARLCALNALAIVKDQLGSLDRVKRIVKLTGYVSSIRSFYNQPMVINGASDLMVEIFGEKGKHARAAVGMVSLPRDATVELDLIVEFK